MEEKIFQAIERQDHDNLRRALLDKDVNEINSEGYTPLYYACMKKGVGVSTVEEILRLGANIDLKGTDDETPLYIASFNGKIDVVLLLLDKGANINIKNGKYEETVLHLAAYTNNCTLLDILISRKANLNIQNIRKETPLYVASKTGHHNVVYRLLNAGADLNIVDIDNKSPLYIASEKGMKHVVIILKSDRKNLVIAKTQADEELRLRPPPFKSTQAICDEAQSDAAAGRPPMHHSSFKQEEENKKREVKPMEVVEIVVPRPKSTLIGPFPSKSEGPCRSLEEVGYEAPPALPPSLQNRPPVKPQRIGGTSMRIGTSIDSIGIEPVRINSIPGDSMEFSANFLK